MKRKILNVLGVVGVCFVLAYNMSVNNVNVPLNDSLEDLLSVAVASSEGSGGIPYDGFTPNFKEFCCERSWPEKQCSTFNVSC